MVRHAEIFGCATRPVPQGGTGHQTNSVRRPGVWRKKPSRFLRASPLSWLLYSLKGQKAGSPMRILIIDDEENIRRITVVVLEAARILGITRDTLPRKKKEISRAPHVQDG